MKPAILYPRSHIYYFQNLDDAQRPQLKNIINFLKWKTLKQIIKFDHIAEDGSLIEELSLHDNLTLESKDFCRYRKIPKNLSKILKENIGESIIPLMDEIPSWNSLTKDLTLKQKKIASILKSLNLASPFIILEKPEKHLDEQSIENLKIVLNDIIQTKNCEIIISNTHEFGIWSDLFTKKVTHKKNSLFVINDFERPYEKTEKEENSKIIKIAA